MSTNDASDASSATRLQAPDPDVRELQVVTLEGCFFRDVRDAIVGSIMARNRTWEYFETEWVKTIVRPGDIVLDAGANLGWFTVIMARQVGGDGRVLAFEPEPRNFELLSKNVAWNGFADRCTLFELALSDEETTHKFELSPTNLGDHRIRIGALPADAREDLYDEAARTEITVQCKRLDDVLATAQVEDSPIRLWKMDTQGSEVSILRGAKRTLERTQYLLTEFWPYGLVRMGHSADDFVSCVKDYFADFCRIESGKLAFQPIDRLREDLAKPSTAACGESNYVFRKDGLPATTYKIS